MHMGIFCQEKPLATCTFSKTTRKHCSTGAGAAEDEAVGWHRRLNGHEFEQTLGDGEEQQSLVCCTPWGRKELDMT